MSSAKPLAFLAHRNRVRPLVAIDPVVLQGVAGIEQVFHLVDTVTFLAVANESLGENQVIDNSLGVGPGAKQVITLEERVMKSINEVQPDKDGNLWTFR